MGFSPGIATGILLGISGLNLGIAAVAVRRREVRGAVPFAVIMVCVSIYALGSGLRAGSTTLATYRLGLVVTYVGLLGVPATELWFVLVYSGHESLLNRRSGALLLVEPVVVFALVVTAPMHDLLWTIEGFTAGPGLATVERTMGPMFWLNIAYGYVLLFASYGLLALVGVRRHRRYRHQVALMLIGGIVPVVASLLFVTGVGPVGAADVSILGIDLRGLVDPTPFAFTVTGIIFALALFRFDFLDLMPVARHTLVDEMADPVFVVDMHGRLTDLNRSAAEFLGSEDAAVGKPAADVIPSFERLNRDERSSEVDVVVEAANGTRYFDASRTWLTDRTGSAVGSLLIYRDVTERHVTEERFQRLIERSSDVVTVMDESGTMTYVSPSVERVLGYDPEELIGETLIERVHPDDREAIAAELSMHADEPGYAGTYVGRFSNAAGNWRTIEARAVNLLEDPYVGGIVLNSRDVTEQRRRSRRLEHQNERLDRFAGIVAHDLRNPLNVAVGRVELLREEIAAEQQDAAESVQRQLERMEAIIGDALTLARSGEALTETTEVRLEAVARNAWKNVDTAGTDLVVETSLHLDGDRDRLLNVFENLYRNSVEHNETTELTVRVGPLSDTFGFYVEDTGVGIPEDKRDQVVEEGYSTNREGTGFGLAIVRDILKAHGWELTVSESDEGGARFEIECYETPMEKQSATV
ncbi:histidine kinase N-terminal 7TM domain-containing protein [Halorubrum sp. Boch-26]|uniref:histidine kinase N-terminal 7TM domain-containing protein n=1 Tax=Halorubrum sp. Boch-26 TaxID=2994426 RepID=UPI00246930B1|nr:histidine kinase N-terminal 7TM domain-containing protein [Halorubrum sp. Boch-26]